MNDGKTTSIAERLIQPFIDDLLIADEVMQNQALEALQRATDDVRRLVGEKLVDAFLGPDKTKRRLANALLPKFGSVVSEPMQMRFAMRIKTAARLRLIEAYPRIAGYLNNAELATLYMNLHVMLAEFVV